MASLVFALVLIATVANGLLAGAGLDYLIKQLPARHKIGIRAYAAYFRASDLSTGRFWYIPLGIGAYSVNFAAAASAYLESPAPGASIAIFAAAALALVHLIGTTQAAPAGLSVRKIPADYEAGLNKAFEKFVRWSYPRGIVGLPMFLASLWALILLS